MNSIPVQRRRVVATQMLAAATAGLATAAGAQTATAPAPGYGRRRVRSVGSVLAIGGMVAAIAAWVFIGGNRARKKEQAKKEMDARLARARERSKNL